MLVCKQSVPCLILTNRTRRKRRFYYYYYLFFHMSTCPAIFNAHLVTLGTKSRQPNVTNELVTVDSNRTSRFRVLGFVLGVSVTPNPYFSSPSRSRGDPFTNLNVSRVHIKATSTKFTTPAPYLFFRVSQEGLY